MPEPRDPVARPLDENNLRPQAALPPASVAAVVMLAGGLGLLAGLLARSWRIRVLTRRARRRVPGTAVRHVSNTRQDASLIGAERFPRKGDDDVTG